MSGRLSIVGLGPGAPELTTPAVSQALREATDLVGYEVYLARLPTVAGQRRHASGNGAELERARHALGLAAQGCRVAVVSSGDPGVFAMAAAVFEAIDRGEARWRDLDIQVLPGVTAMLAAAAHAGAPLGGDFCAISLSDNLKAWTTIERRLEAAAHGDFVIALYNPASRARPDLLTRALESLRKWKSAETVILFVRAAGTLDADVRVTSLKCAGTLDADMRTLVLCGSSKTRLVPRQGAASPWVYTPRSEDARP